MIRGAPVASQMATTLHVTQPRLHSQRGVGWGVDGLPCTRLELAYITWTFDTLLKYMYARVGGAKIYADGYSVCNHAVSCYECWVRQYCWAEAPMQACMPAQRLEASSV